jgi:hypothetical protein
MTGIQALERAVWRATRRSPSRARRIASISASL